MIPWGVTTFDSVADELYGAPRDEFTALRDERARAARAEGDRDGERALLGLRKPTVAAWLVNQVARQYPDDLARAADLGDRLRQAHRRLAGDELRVLSRERRDVLAVLDDRVLRVARSGAIRPTDAVDRQVRETFDALVADPRAEALVRAGRLAAALRPSASGEWPEADVTVPAMVPRAVPDRSVPARPRKAAAEPEPSPPDTTAADRRRAREAAAEAHRRTVLAERDRDRAERRLAAADQDVDRAAAEVERLRAELADAREAHGLAREDAGAARTALRAAEREVDAARRAEDAARDS